ncbi:dihydrofolate synthase/folylpolyglutamate synthase [Parabacteroides sp. PF5-5]|uniref:bifunctional folylpolyglutamate synthase/dihydrofolate synthase n=1 Tax=unclassified Parabacteroides TaxID=2649774 RepID=UPI0024767D86|nr:MULTISPECIES: folylpolyglutamate synthase/dihydrofolate synthase family protein [unclassified Parabacteroides]MDH6305808.1 dihydrofolate synthase/folylpolyglutamate synthase [Parabacteroides sp. PH5-39]MDH6317755.1 dihydrofolate synthase/folylpolyglutamate synthase [Parabacteroides sp. PF5-13]MDH6320586.1 dihydrofolate synthase/folylpolyglutamate synthase [Parabacteroides sp. PH5-13]MDH6324251.1 dihydrofolate synthase/folylpolyglutamate synthase [Parabacteroides sp. PH5-8]MDH6328940.1 dihyd
MTYEETLQYLYTSTPVFEHSGASAYKPGLQTSIALDNYFRNPHKSYKTIHVGGTNGKGSVCHLLAAILQKSGYKVGLYTSPHLVDFRERIRVNGEMIPKEYVVDFVGKHKCHFEPLHPSFFELVSTMAFDYFRSEKVDYAIIEVGLGGRLDSTNIITPVVSVITNISLDHTQYLGETLGEIAYEKAGIIKPEVPVVIGEAADDVVAGVFIRKAEEVDAPLFFAQEEEVLKGEVHLSEKGEWYYDSADYGQLFGQLSGFPQLANTQTVLCVLRVLASMEIEIPKEAVRAGFEHVVEVTGLQGRWQEVFFNPYTVMDTGHNTAAWGYLTAQIEAEAEGRPHLYMIIGLSSDKDIDGILQMMPKHATYLFTQASTGRALPADVLAMHARSAGLEGETYDSVVDAIYQVLRIVGDDDMVFIGGSNFIVAEALPLYDENNFK